MWEVEGKKKLQKVWENLRSPETCVYVCVPPWALSQTPGVLILVTTSTARGLGPFPRIVVSS
eukprot:795714-Pyramimonas_sp.AAC.1